MGENKNCYSGRPLPFIRVRWNENNRSGKISVRSATANTELTVSITPLLKQGELEPSTSFQVIEYNTIPAIIRCSKASGGNCSPVYTYQWEQSANSVSWTEVSRATTPDLNFSAPLKESRYYRRRVIETGSQTRAYSAVVSIIVKEPARNN